MFEGLHIYEIVLMVCGVLLFAVGLFGIAVRIAKGGDLKPLATIMLISVVMIGFPAIQKISYEDGKLTIDKYAKLGTDLTEEQRADLGSAVSKVEGRLGIGKDPGEGAPEHVKSDTLLQLAKANLKLGNLKRSFVQINSVSADGTAKQEVADLQRKIAADVIGAHGRKTTSQGPANIKRTELTKAVKILGVNKDKLKTAEAQAFIDGLHAIGKSEQAIAEHARLRLKHTTLRARPTMIRTVDP